MDAVAPNPWLQKLVTLLDPPQSRDPGDLLQNVWQIAIAMGHDTAEDLLDAHPELFRFFPLLSRAYGQQLRNKEIAETQRLRGQDWTGPKLFKDVASPPSVVTYERVSAMFENVDFGDCKRLVMVGCGRIPATVFHAHDRTKVPEIVALDIVPEVIDDMEQLVGRLGYARVRENYATVLPTTMPAPRSSSSQIWFPQKPQSSPGLPIRRPVRSRSLFAIHTRWADCGPIMSSDRSTLDLKSWAWAKRASIGRCRETFI